MNINGNSIFMGAYEERRQQNEQINCERFVISEEKQLEIEKQLEAAMKSIDWGSNQSAKVFISKEDMDFLCSEKGFEKMKQDAADLYLKNANRQREIAAGREESDVFWKNTGNQWMLFSEYLYNNDFYTDMTDEEVKEMENTLAKITAGMDHLSRSQYMTGMEFSDYYGHGANYFMGSAEVLMELEASTSALKYFADKYVADDKKKQFNELVDLYHTHNSQIIDEYVNPMESFNKVVHGIHSGKYPNSTVMNEMSNHKVVDEYKYTILSGGITKTQEEKEQFQEDMSALFESLRQKEEATDVLWSQLKTLYVHYTTDYSDDESFQNYVWDKSAFTVKRIQNYWNSLISK